MPCLTCRWNTGFSLIEVLVVVATIAVLVALLLPVLPGLRRNAQIAGCMQNLRQHGISTKIHSLDAFDRLPAPIDQHGQLRHQFGDLNDDPAFTRYGWPGKPTLTLLLDAKIAESASFLRSAAFWSMYWLEFDEMNPAGDSSAGEVIFSPGDPLRFETKSSLQTTLTQRTPIAVEGIDTDLKVGSYRMAVSSFIQPEALRQDATSASDVNPPDVLSANLGNDRDAFERWTKLARTSDARHPSSKVVFFLGEAVYDRYRLPVQRAIPWSLHQATNTSVLFDGSVRVTRIGEDHLPYRSTDDAEYESDAGPLLQNIDKVDSVIHTDQPFLVTRSGVRGRDF